MNYPNRRPEFSVVMPCLNEAETLARCIEKSMQSFRDLSVSGEVVVADNGSSDGSQAIAERHGARVVPVKEKGYGCALRGGIHGARGKYVIMGDSDDSYDFSSLEPFVAALRQGNDLVMGNRFRGKIMPGAMPWKHRWIGNPVLTTLGRIFFRSPVGDFHCGLRGLSKDAFERMELQTTGMEFASEMVIKSTLLGMKIAEVPIVLHKDGRSRPPHLRSWRDGWRHLRFMLQFSPLWLFLIPGAAMLLLGLASGVALSARSWRVGVWQIGMELLPASAFLCILGYQLVVFAAFAKSLAVKQGLHPRCRALERLQRFLALETGIVFGTLLVLAGIATLAWGVPGWAGGALRTLAVTLLAFGAQTIFASFFLSILGMLKRIPKRQDQAS